MTCFLLTAPGLPGILYRTDVLRKASSVATFGDLRARVRRALEDTDATAYLWTDAELGDDLAQAYRGYSLRFPRETSVTFYGSTLTYALPADARRVVTVESPVGTPLPARGEDVAAAPSRTQSWAVFGGNLVFQEAPPGPVVVSYRGLYPVPGSDVAASGLPDEGEDVVVLGAVVSALQRRAVSAGKRRGAQGDVGAALTLARTLYREAVRRCQRPRMTVMQGEAG